METTERDGELVVGVPGKTAGSGGNLSLKRPASATASVWLAIETVPSESTSRYPPLCAVPFTLSQGWSV